MKQCSSTVVSDRIIDKIVTSMGEDSDGVALLCISDNVFHSCLFVKHILRYVTNNLLVPSITTYSYIHISIYSGSCMMRNRLRV